jgi:hypothetical protein
MIFELAELDSALLQHQYVSVGMSLKSYRTVSSSGLEMADLEQEYRVGFRTTFIDIRHKWLVDIKERM